MKEVFCGIHLDEKPTGVPDGSEYIEVDTKDIYIFYNGTWYKQKDKILDKLEDKEVTITENTVTTLTPSEGKIGFSEVKVTTNISGGGDPDWSEYFRDALEGGTSANNARSKFVKLFIKFPYKFIPVGNNLDYCFRDFSYLTETPDIDMTNITSMVYTFDSCIRLDTIRQYDTSNVTNMGNFCSNTNITSFPLLNTSNVTNMSKMLETCTRLTTVPILDTSSVTDMTNMFNNDLALTTDSLDNILQMCINATSYTGTKTLATLGISNVNYYPVATIQALPHYSDFVSAGWSIGY